MFFVNIPSLCLNTPKPLMTVTVVPTWQIKKTIGIVCMFTVCLLFCPVLQTYYSVQVMLEAISP